MSTNLWQKELTWAIEAVQRAGAELLAMSHAPAQEVLSAQGHDIKLKADRIAEDLILQTLHTHSGLPILTEETGLHGANEMPPQMWVVDPLDGTFNYFRKMPLCCSCVGLWVDGRPMLGAIFNFFTGDLYTGIAGQGAFLNGKGIAVSSVSDVRQAALATGFPSYRDMSDAALQVFIRRVQKFKKIRMIGSAALALAYVASGWVEAYHEDDIMLWDVVAAGAIAQAAGAHLTIEPGAKQPWGREVACVNLPVIAEALKV